MVTFEAVSNESYNVMTCVLHHGQDSQMFFDGIPTDIEKRVKLTYDGVWLPRIESIKVFRVEEVEN